MSTPHSPKRARKSPKTGPESHSSSLFRLIAAVLLFSVCFVAKTQFPSQTQRWRAQLAQLIGTHTDLHQSLDWLGEELERQRTVFHAVGDWCVEVFGTQDLSLPSTQPEATAPPENAQERAAESAQPEGKQSSAAVSEGEQSSVAVSDDAPEGEQSSAAVSEGAPEGGQASSSAPAAAAEPPASNQASDRDSADAP